MLLLPGAISTVRAQSASPSTAATAGAFSTAPAGSPREAAQPLIDLNTASAEELQALKGIGPARAAAIGKGRPCKGKDELQRKDIIPPAVYEDIKDQIAARQKGLGGSDDHTGTGVSPSQGQEPQDSQMHRPSDAAAVGQASP